MLKVGNTIWINPELPMPISSEVEASNKHAVCLYPIILYDMANFMLHSMHFPICWHAITSEDTDVDGANLMCI